MVPSRSSASIQPQRLPSSDRPLPTRPTSDASALWPCQLRPLHKIVGRPIRCPCSPSFSSSVQDLLQAGTDRTALTRKSFMALRMTMRQPHHCLPARAHQTPPKHQQNVFDDLTEAAAAHGIVTHDGPNSECLPSHIPRDSQGFNEANGFFLGPRLSSSASSHSRPPQQF